MVDWSLTPSLHINVFLRSSTSLFDDLVPLVHFDLAPEPVAVMRHNAEVLVNKVKLIRRGSRQVYQLKLVLFVDLVGVSCAAIFFHFIHHARKLYDSPLILPQKNQRQR